MYTELTSLSFQPPEKVTDYKIRAEKAGTALCNAGEDISDSLLIAMVLEGLPDNFKPFIVVVIQKEKEQTFTEFKSALRSSEGTERVKMYNDDSVLQASNANNNNTGKKIIQYQGQKSVQCYKCNKFGHFVRNCQTRKLWCTFCKKDNHNDHTCRSKNKNGRDSTIVVDTAEPTEEHSFAFVIEDQDQDISSIKHDKILVDCGATSHIITDISRSSYI